MFLNLRISICPTLLSGLRIALAPASHMERLMRKTQHQKDAGARNIFMNLVSKSTRSKILHATKEIRLNAWMIGLVEHDLEYIYL